MDFDKLPKVEGVTWLKEKDVSEPTLDAIRRHKAGVAALKPNAKLSDESKSYMESVVADSDKGLFPFCKQLYSIGDFNGNSFRQERRENFYADDLTVFGRQV